MRLTLYLLLALVLAGCSRSPAQPPAKPSKVPPEAVWSGGVDGGSFLHCSVNLQKDVDHCRVYNDFTGDLECEADFRLEPENRAARPEELRFDGAFDGKYIFLQGLAADGKVRRLKPLVPCSED